MSYVFDDGFPSDLEAKREILEVGRRMYAKNFVASNDGNISCKVSDHTLWCTPTGVSKGYMTDEMLVLMDLDGNVLRGTWKPSSEMKMHLRVYKENPSVMAVVHAHPPVSTSFAIAGIPLNRAILTEAVMGIGEIPLAPYAMPGTQEVPDSIAPFVKTHNGCLLANHGALTWGSSVMEAWMRMESVEYYATVSMYTSNIIGQANELTCDQVDRLIERRTNSGITTGGRPLCRDCSEKDTCQFSTVRTGSQGFGQAGSCPHSGGQCTGSCSGNHHPDQQEMEEIIQIVRQVIAQRGGR
ncbi:MAG: class II aldolase/adducin family protein [Parasporobacterium sp.]|nr:class II aldolase/adducin family protein [Parasporobacterium sp.]